MEVRRVCMERRFDCLAVDLPAHFEPFLPEAVESLPEVRAIVVREGGASPLYYLPIDPCDGAIEAVRQSFFVHSPFVCVGYPVCMKRSPLPALPDDHAIGSVGIDAWNAMCLQALSAFAPDGADELHARYMASRLAQLRESFGSVLAVIHLRRVARTLFHLKNGSRTETLPSAPPLHDMSVYPVNPDHLYFCLGELPFVTGKYERERYDPLSPPFDPVTSVKDLFRETRDEHFVDHLCGMHLSPVRIQAALTFLRNLTVRDCRLMPSLFDIVQAAAGVGGNAYGCAILKAARYYPFFSPESGAGVLDVGIGRIRTPDCERSQEAVNLLRDHEFVWRRVALHPEPSNARAERYRYRWNDSGICSHIPEDIVIERFNDTVRHRALRSLAEDRAVTEKFSTSVKDGIDIRDTLRFWHTGDIFVRELPPSRGRVDMVVIVFDDGHDELYPLHTTWYAEHPDESTLMFYSTDPFDNLVGPGIARCRYGGLALLYPPRPVPDIFQIPVDYDSPTLAARLTLGAMMFSRERLVAYVAQRRPAAFLNNLARRYGKHLVWVPMGSFSHETVQRLRQFHILNGKNVRSWASRFIGE